MLQSIHTNNPKCFNFLSNTSKLFTYYIISSKVFYTNLHY